MALDSFLQVNHTSTADMAHSSSPTTMMPRTQPQQLQQYSYQTVSSPAQSAAPIRFIDNNPRPAKSPRHIPPPASLPQPAYPDNGARFTPAYNGSAEGHREPYFPTSLPMHQQAWTSASDTPGVYGATMQAPTSNLQHHYQFPNDSYVKDENNHTQQNYTWNPS